VFLKETVGGLSVAAVGFAGYVSGVHKYMFIVFVRKMGKIVVGPGTPT